MTTAHPANPGSAIEHVTFQCGQETLDGHLHVPSAGGRMQGAVVVTGAWMTVKEQMADRYASELARHGFVALTFDFRGWGKSSGARRQYEDPASKVDDIKAAVSYLSARADFNPRRIAGLGICASSGYMVAAATTTPQLASVALVAPWLHDRAIIEQTYGGADSVAKLLEAGDAAEATYRSSGKQVMVPAASLTDERAIMFKAPYYTEPERGFIAGWRNEADLAFWRPWLTFDGLRFAPLLKQPFFMVHSEQAAIPAGAHQFYEGLATTKSQLWLEDVSQFDFYDQASAVSRASDAVAEHFRSTLNSVHTE